MYYSPELKYKSVKLTIKGCLKFDNPLFKYKIFYNIAFTNKLLINRNICSSPQVVFLIRKICFGKISWLECFFENLDKLTFTINRVSNNFPVTLKVVKRHQLNRGRSCWFYCCHNNMPLIISPTLL